jgi:hypothetical protein
MDIKINKRFVNEIIRQICHPKTGISRHFYPKPSKLSEWIKCLNNTFGWVNIGINDKMETLFRKLNIGEVISTETFNMNLYKNGFATNEICKFLQLNSSETKYRSMMNYKSFTKLINIILTGKSNEYRRIFNESFNKIFTNIHPRIFWLNILINDVVANFLFKNKIGEVIVKDTDMESDSESSSVELNDNMDCSDYNFDIENPNTNDMDEKIYNRKIDIEKDSENQLDNIYFRLVMNNKTLLNFIEYGCQINNIKDTNTNIFEAMGGNDDDLLNIFGRMKI